MVHGHRPREALLAEVRNELSLDDLFEELRYRTAQIEITEARRDELLDAVVTVARDLDLSATLRRIAEAAWSVVGCRYAALGVLGPDRDLVDFIYAGEGVRTQELDLHAGGRVGIGPGPTRLPDQALLRLLERSREGAAEGLSAPTDTAGLGPAGLGPAGLGPADHVPGGLGPAGHGPADLGPAGSAGPVSLAGPVGLVGLAGVAGVAGVSGASGPVGLVGGAGSAGLAGPGSPYLGVPVQARGEVIGSLYLAEKDGGGAFTPEDESLLAALAAVAGAAIATARAYDNLPRRRAWQAAATEVSVALLTGDPADALDVVAAGVQRAAEAELVLVETAADRDHVLVAATSGPDTWDLRGRIVRHADAPLLREVHITDRPLLISDGARDDRVRRAAALAGLAVGPMIVLPLSGHEQLGALIVARKPAASQFGPLDVELAIAFANTVAIALEFAQLHHSRERRRAWQEVSVEVATVLLTADRSHALELVATGVQRVTSAEVVSVLVPASGSRVRVAGFAGSSSSDLGNRILEPDDALLYRSALESGEVVLVEDALVDPRCAYHVGQSGRPLGSVMMLPLVAQERILGALFVARAAGDVPFDALDVELAASFTCDVALALEFTQLYDATQRRQAWLAASATVTTRLLDAKPDEALGLVARGVRQVAGAAMAAVEVPISNGAVMLEAFDGEGEGDQPGRVIPLEDAPLYQHVMCTGEALAIADAGVADSVGHSPVLAGRQVGPVMAVPLRAGDRTIGIVALANPPGAAPFSSLELELATTFAGHAALALEAITAQQAARWLAVLEDRERIARDLHDGVIQRMFSAGLRLQGLSSSLVGRDAARLAEVVDELDQTIRDVRSTIFSLRTPEPDETSMAARILDVVSDVKHDLGYTPDLHIQGPLDQLVPLPVQTHLLAALREALTNVAQHAEATATTILVKGRPSEVMLEVSDNGRGIPADAVEGGLATMRSRAAKLDGELELVPGPSGGLTLVWRVPLAAGQPPGQPALRG